MILESHYWKTDLTKMADKLANRATKGRWTERSLVRLEKDVFTAFYSIRKLMEAKKLTDKVLNRPIPMSVHQPTGKRVTLINWHKIDKLYNLDRSTKLTKSLKFVCDQFIHSYIYFPSFDERGRELQAFLITSERLRTSGLFVLDIAVFLRVLRDVGKCDQISMHMTFNSSVGDYDVHSS